VASNLETAQQLNKLLREQRDLIQSVNQNLQKQSIYYREICAAMSKNCNTELDKMDKAIDKNKESLESARDSAEKAGGGFNALGKAAKNATKPLKLLGSVTKGIMMAAAMAVMKLVGAYEGLITQAGKVYDEMLQITRATENVRDKFGTLSHGAGKNVIDMTKRMGTRFRQMGVSMGFGYAASAKLVEVMNEYAGSMSAVGFARFSTLSGQAQTDIISLGMSVGLTGQETGALTNRFIALGLNASDEMGNVAHVSMKLNKIFGLNAKKTSKDIAKMSGNVKIYGNMSVKAMGEALGAAAQLGVGIEELTGVSEAFYTFEGAVEATSKLSQAFGMNLDVMKMMQSDNPADTMRMLRQSMEEAGKSVETMTRREKHYLGQQLKLTGAQAELMFSTQAQTMSQDELAKAMENTDPQQQMVNSMKSVGDNIKSVINSLADMDLAGKGFFGAFTTGLSQGLFRFGEFAKIAGKTGGTLKMLRAEGQRLGEMLTKGPDSAGKGAGALHSTFVALGAAINSVHGHFKKFLGEGGPLDTFMKVLGKGNPDAIRDAVMTLAESIMACFKAIFSGNATVAKQFGEAMKGLFQGLQDVFSVYIMPELRAFGRKAVDFLSAYFGPVLLAMAGYSIGSVIAGFVSLTAIIGGLAKIPLAAIGKAILAGAGIALFVGVTLMSLGYSFLLFDRHISTGIKHPELTITAMQGLAKISIAMIPALIAAAALGVLISGPQAVGLLSLAAGTAVLVTFINAMAVGLVPVMSTIASVSDQIRDPRKFEAASSLFIGILTKMSGMMGSVSAIIKSTKPSIFSIISGKGGTMADNLDGVTDVMDSLLGDKSKGMIGMAFTLIAGVREISFSSSEIRATLALAELIGAVAEAMESISGPMNNMSRIMMGDQILQLVSFGLLGGDQSVEGILSSLSEYMITMSDIMAEKIPQMATSMTDMMGSLDAGQIENITKGAQLMGSIMGAVGTAMSMLMNPTSGVSTWTGRAKAAFNAWLTGPAYGESMDQGIRRHKTDMMAGNAKMLTDLLGRQEISDLVRTINSSAFPSVSEAAETKITAMARAFEIINKTTTALSTGGSNINTANRALVLMTRLNYGENLKTGLSGFLDAISGPEFKTAMTSGFEQFKWLGDNIEEHMLPNAEKIAESVAKIALAIPTINRQLAALDIVTIQAQMERIGATALFGENDVTVTTSGDNPQIQFHINITMDAAEVADAMVNSSIIPGTGLW
jgi:hypothetical protein